MSLHHDRSEFSGYDPIGSLASARTVAPIVLRHLRPLTILDVGCGTGAWVRAYQDAGASYVVGVDGDDVRPEQLLFDPSRFHALDVSGVFRLPRQFDLVQCLELAAHLPPSCSEALVDNLVSHGPVVMFSSAPPGQGGENQINERPYEYWRDLFAVRGYGLFDFLRPAIRFRMRVEPWYRYNLLVFVHDNAVDSLEPAVAATRVKPGDRVPDWAPAAWRMRRRILSVLPPTLVGRMTSANRRMKLRKHSRQAETERVEPT